MKQNLLNSIRLRIVMLVALMCSIGTGMVWGDDVTVTWNISGVATTASYQQVNTELTSSITPSGASGTWTAVSDGNNSYAGSSSGAQLGASSNREFTGTISLSSTSIPSSAIVKSVAVSAKSNGSSTLSATVGGVSLGDSKTISGTTVNNYTISGSSQTGNNIVLTLSGTTASKYVNISKIVVTYEEATVKTDPTITFSNGSVRVGKTLDLSTLFTSNSEGAVTYSITAGGSYATLSSSTLTATAAGSVTVKAEQAAAGNYNAGEATATITVTNPALSSIAITTAPTKTTYTEGETFDPTGMVVTATYSDATTDDVTASCTYSPNTALSTSNTAITVSYTENNVTKTATQTISVSAYVQPTEFDINLNNTLFGTNYTGTVSNITDENPVSGSLNNVTVTYAGSGTHYINSSQIRFYPSNKLTFEAPSGYNIKQIEFTAGDTWTATISANVGTYTSSTKKWTGEAASVLFTGSGSGQCRMTKASITLEKQKIPVNITGISATATTLNVGSTATVSVTNDQVDWTPAYTYNSSTPSVATVSGNGVVTAVAEGTTTITVALDIDNSDTEYKKGATNSMTIDIVVTAATIYNATFKVNGENYASDAAIKDAAITFPANPESIGGLTFIGWVKQGDEVIAANVVNAANMGSADVTYLAVFGNVIPGESSLTKMTSSDTFSENDKVVIVAPGETSYAMYQETYNDSYVNKYTFDNNAETIAADDKKWFTVSEGSANSTWKLGDSTNGYVYTSGSNNLAISTESSTDFTLAWNSDESKFTLVGNSRWLSYRSDLSNKYFRMGGVSTNDPSGLVYFDIYKLVTGTPSYTNLTTTIAPVSVTVSDAGYATFADSKARDFSESGIKAFYATVSSTELTFHEITKVPANTGVLLYKDGGTTGAVNVPAVVGDADDVTGNVFVKGTGAAVSYAADNQNYILFIVDDVLGFYQANNNTVAANRAYIHIDGGNGVKSFSINLDAVVDGIRSIDNGQLTIDNGQIYNLAGQRLSKMQKGINIINGKKILVK